MAYTFERFIFFQASSRDRELISALQLLHPRLNSRNTVYYNNTGELDLVESHDLVVCCGTSLALVHDTLQAAGHVAAIPLVDFVGKTPRILDLQATGVLGEVVLAFLSERLKIQAMRMFSLFGFSVVAVDSTQALLKELKLGAGLVVFDQDMPALKNRISESREKIFFFFRSERRHRRQLAVVIVKDFDQGSLFGDMTTLAKDVSNAMLAPHEFLEFMRNYLGDFLVARATWKMRVGNATGLAQSTYAGRPAPFLGLSDVKNAFQLFQDKAYHEYIYAREQMLAETRDIDVRMAVTEWLFDKDLAHAAESASKNLAVKSDMPQFFDILRPEPGDDKAHMQDGLPQNSMFN